MSNLAATAFWMYNRYNVHVKVWRLVRNRTVGYGAPFGNKKKDCKSKAGSVQ